MNTGAPRATHVIVCVGTGGVGKTTVAAALGAKKAQEGSRVLVLTIDPSRRLKTTLGLADDGTVREISHSRIRGTLSAAVVNSKQVFDEFVLRAADKAPLVVKLMKNRLYQQLSTTLSGSQEFTALERLFSAYESGEYDVIVLDTPPSQHVLDFLRAPQKLAALFQEDIAKWFRGPQGGATVLSFFQRALHAGTREALRIFEMMTGSEFIRELGEFFVAIQGWQQKLEKRNAEIHRMLIGPQSRFYLVTTYDHVKLLEGADFAKEIRHSGYALTNVIVNKAFPNWLSAFSLNPHEQDQVTNFASEWAEFYRARRTNAEQAFILPEFKKAGVMISELPELARDVRDLDGVWDVADSLGEV